MVARRAADRPSATCARGSASTEGVPWSCSSFGGLGLPGFDPRALEPIESRFRFLDASDLPAIA